MESRRNYLGEGHGWMDLSERILQLLTLAVIYGKMLAEILLLWCTLHNADVIRLTVYSTSYSNRISASLFSILLQVTFVLALLFIQLLPCKTYEQKNTRTTLTFWFRQNSCIHLMISYYSEDWNKTIFHLSTQRIYKNHVLCTVCIGLQLKQFYIFYQHPKRALW